MGPGTKVCAGCGFEGRRDEAIVRFLLDTGCRVSELCGITIDDLDLDRETALVLGKGSKRRSVYFGAKTVRSLDRYLRERRTHRQAHSPALFLSQRGPYSADGVRDLLRRLAPRAASTGCTRTGSATPSPTTSCPPAAKDRTSSASQGGRATSCSSGTGPAAPTCGHERP